MPRYFFHVRNRNIRVPDEEGMDFPDYEAALHEARESARDLLLQCIRNREDATLAELEITDSNGSVFERVKLMELLQGS